MKKTNGFALLGGAVAALLLISLAACGERPAEVDPNNPPMTAPPSK